MITRAFDIDTCHENERRFVLSAFCLGAGQPEGVLEGILARGGRVMLGQTNGGELAGFVVVDERKRVVWAYTKVALRRMKVATRCLAGLGLTKAEPIELYYATQHVLAVARHWRQIGWQIYAAKKKEIRP